MTAFAIITSPDGKYSVEQHEDFGEIGMGSPLFGHITINGTDARLSDGFYGEPVVFSPDSRFVALEELVETSPFRTRLVVVELPKGKMHLVRLQPRGTVTPLRWDGDRKLIYIEWSVGLPREQGEWIAPEPEQAKKSIFSFWK